MPHATYAWPNGSLICGACHHGMDCSVSKNDIPVELRTRCVNSKCANYGKIFRVEPKNAIQLTDITDAVVEEALAKVIIK